MPNCRGRQPALACRGPTEPPKETTMPAARPKSNARRIPAADPTSQARPLQPVRLVGIHIGDFRRSPRANLAEALEAWPARGTLGDGEALLVESRGGNKLLFCFRPARGRDRDG